MDVQPDFKDLLSLFKVHHVEYVRVASNSLNTLRSGVSNDHEVFDLIVFFRVFSVS